MLWMCRFYASTNGFNATMHATVYATNADAIPATIVYFYAIYPSKYFVCLEHLVACDTYGLLFRSIHTVYKKPAWSMFYGNLELPELDKIQAVRELLYVKYGLISLPLFDVSQVDFMLESLCTHYLFFTYFLSVLFVQFCNEYSEKFVSDVIQKAYQLSVMLMDTKSRLKYVTFILLFKMSVCYCLTVKFFFNLLGKKMASSK